MLLSGGNVAAAITGVHFVIRFDGQMVAYSRGRKRTNNERLHMLNVRFADHNLAHAHRDDVARVAAAVGESNGRQLDRHQYEAHCDVLAEIHRVGTTASPPPPQPPHLHLAREARSVHRRLGKHNGQRWMSRVLNSVAEEVLYIIIVVYFRSRFEVLFFKLDNHVH